MKNVQPHYKIPNTYFIRSSIFNVCFYGLNVMACLIALPFLFAQRDRLMKVVRLYLHCIYFIERSIMNLDYRIKGQEHLPKGGSYIVAAKHQSPYETLKLHMLFGDPAIILKKELLRIPIWGQYLKKTDVIAIDRSTPEAAIESIKEGSRRMQAQGRPIVIFPQGTRVDPNTSTEEKPYKIGVARIQEATSLPIIPVALNCGLFWSKSGWCKHPGIITFEFLPPIEAGLPKSDVLLKLEESIETKTKELMDMEQKRRLDALVSNDRQNSFLKRNITQLVSGFIILLFCLYSGWWYFASQALKGGYIQAFQNNPEITRVTKGDVNVSGYPGTIHIQASEESLSTPQGHILINDMNLYVDPLNIRPTILITGPVSVNSFRWPDPLIFDSLESKFSYSPDNLDLMAFRLIRDNLKIELFGVFNSEDIQNPDLDFTARVQGAQNFLTNLINDGIIDQQAGLTAGFVIASFEKDGVIEIPIYSRNRSLYLGPLRAGSLEDFLPHRRPPEVVQEPYNPPVQVQ